MVVQFKGSAVSSGSISNEALKLVNVYVLVHESSSQKAAISMYNFVEPGRCKKRAEMVADRGM